MLLIFSETILRKFSISKRVIAMTTLFFSYAVLSAHAQSFNSGSTGADGAFNPTTSQTITLPASGVFNYTTVNIPAGVTITYTRNANNTPVTILASGDVTITGVINVDGKNGVATSGGAGGPGGFRGGASGMGTSPYYSGVAGDGPGGGGGGGSTSGSNVSAGGGGGFATAGGGGGGISGGSAGPQYGSAALLPLIGGSGGGGGGALANGTGGAGGGGGGAILIASSGSIIFNGGNIYARGGNGSSLSGGAGAGGGAGGAIRLVASSIPVGSGGYLYVSGGIGSNSPNYTTVYGGNGASGWIRIEAYDLKFTNGASGSAIFNSYASPYPVNVSNGPTLKITSVAGISAPTTPTGSFGGSPDVVVPTSQANPVTVAIAGTNVPVGTTIQVTLIPASGARTTSNSTPLSGTLAASTATASVSLTPGMNMLSATATLDLTASAKPLLMDGERVDRIELAAVYGGASEVTYITHSGKRIKQINP